MIAVVDAEGHRLYNSPAYQTVLGYSPEELKRTNSLEQVHPDDRERLMAAAARARRTGRGERLEYRILHKDGSWRILESTASVVRNGKGEIEHFVIVNRDITERRRAEDLLEYNSLHDGLTRLPNRALLLRQLHRAFAFAKRHSDYNFALLFLDVDGFKLINESLGHEAGDELLVDLAVRLKASLRSLDTVARASRDMVNHSNDTDTGDTGLAKLGGDEYAVLLDDICHPTDAVRVANRLQQILELPFLIRGRELVVSVSLGIAFNQGTYREAPEMLRDAEIAMHRAKKRGKSQYEVFDNAMHTQAIRRLEIETDLRRGIAQGELKVFYQPIVSLESGLIVGLEALSRWQHPSGMIMPAEFIEVADETGLIVPINRQLIREACQALRDWRALSALQPPLFISVNISPRHFADPDLANDVAEILREAGLEPDGIELEILETVAMGDPDTANKTLSKLKEIGVRLSIDDFGTG
jgi:PAS domain S-box-containing protein